MQILTKKISTRTAAFVSQIEQSIHLPIRYFDISSRPNMNDAVAGTVDVHPADGIYKVWLQASLPQNPFESDLLHELYHIVQIESGYSEVCNKSTSEFHSTDGAFIQEVGNHLSSVILDLDVNIWLTRNGYSYDYFSVGNLDALLANKNCRYTRLDDPLNFANLCWALLHAALSSGGEAIQQLCDAYSSYPQIIRTVSELYNELTKMTIDNPKSAMRGHCLVIDTLNLWKYYFVAAPGIKVRTHKEYEAFLSSQNIGKGTPE